MTKQPDYYMTLSELMTSIGSNFYQPSTLELITSLGNKLQSNWASPFSQLTDRLRSELIQPSAFDSVRMLQESTKYAFGLNSYLKNLDTLSKSLLPFKSLSASLIEQATGLQELQKTAFSGDSTFLSKLQPQQWTISDQVLGTAFLETPQDAIDYFSRKPSQEALECVLENPDIAKEIEELVERRSILLPTTEESYTFQEHDELLVQKIVQVLHDKLGWKKARTGKFIVFFFFLISSAYGLYKSASDDLQQKERHEQMQQTIRQQSNQLKDIICEQGQDSQPCAPILSPPEMDHIVYACPLRVRPTKSARIVGELLPGNQVIVLKKKPNLCLVQLSTNSIVIGWVEQKNLATYQ